MKIEINVLQGKQGAIYITTGKGFMVLTRSQIDFLGIDVTLVENFKISDYEKHYGLTD